MAEAQKQESRHYAWWIMLACGFILFGALGSTSSCAGVFFPAVIEGLGVTAAGVSLYISFMTGTMALTQPLARKIMSLFDVRVIISAAIIICCTGFALMGTYNSLIGFYFSGVLVGLGHSFLTFQLVPIMITRWFKTKVGFAMGFAVAMSNVGGAILAPICGQLIGGFGYKTAYILISLIGAGISLPFAAFVLRNNPETKGLKPYGEENISSSALNNTGKQTELKGLSFAEATKSPYFIICVLFALSLSFALNFLVQATNLAYSYGFPVELGSVVASIMTVGCIVGSFAFGWLNDRVGVRLSIGAGIMFGVIGLAMLMLGVTSNSIVFAAMALFGIATALFSIAPPLVTKGIVGDKEYDKIYSYIASCLTIASTFASPIYGALYDKSGNYNSSVVVVISCLLLSMVLCVIGVTGAQKRWAAK